MKMRYMIVPVFALLTLAGCSNLTPNQNALLVGTGGGAAGGAVIGALAGNAALGTAIGAGVGLVGGAIYNHMQSQ